MITVLILAIIILVSFWFWARKSFKKTDMINGFFKIFIGAAMCICILTFPEFTERIQYNQIAENYIFLATKEATSPDADPEVAQLWGRKDPKEVVRVQSHTSLWNPVVKVTKEKLSDEEVLEIYVKDKINKVEDFTEQ